IHAHHSRLELPPTNLDLTFQDIITRLKQSTQASKQHQHQHSKLRASHLESLAEARVVQRSPDLSYESMQEVRSTRTQKKLRQLIQWEAMRKSYRKIGKLLNPNQQQVISSVD
ncbi:MAG: hypothetical protein ACK53Y_24700, partial [bacterium]